MPLNDPKLRSAKPRDKAYKLTDEKGLYVLIKPTGGKLWRFDYRHEGKRQTLAIGSFPDVGLAKARERLAAARAQLADGINPGVAKQEAKAARRLASANSFEAVAREWLAKEQLADITRKKALWLFESFTFPWIGKTPVN